MNDRFQVGIRAYSIVFCQCLQFRAIGKEYGTRGHLYIAWAHNSLRQCFVAQSVPALIEMIREVCGIKLYCSAFYRVVRGLTRHPKTRGFQILKARTVAELNEQLARFELLFCCSQDFEKWVVDETSLPS
jgi:hypothetical protein